MTHDAQAANFSADDSPNQVSPAIISHIDALTILDSRGNPTIQATVHLNSGVYGTASVPSGASTGTHEVLELRDKGDVFGGLGVTKAIEHIQTTILPALKGLPIEKLDVIDETMISLDGTDNKSHLGGNTILAVSLAAMRAFANYSQQSLWQAIHTTYFSANSPDFPRLMVNILNGGAHGGWNVDFQEYMIIPTAKSPSEAVRVASEVFHELKDILHESGQSVGVGDEGGFAPTLDSNKEGFTLLQKAISNTHHQNNVELGCDIAASEFFSRNSYHLKRDDKKLSSQDLLHYYQTLINQFGIFSIEDPFHEDELESFQQLTELVAKGHSKLIVGDDLYTTNSQRLQKGIDMKATNAILVKPNQIGSLLETVNTIKLAQENGLQVIISHRSGETNDPFVADLAYGCGAQFLKAGSMSRGERLAKYNRLLEIENN